MRASSFAACRVEGGIDLIGAPGRVQDHVLNQDDSLAPVVEGGQLADQGHDGVGMAEIVLGDVGEVLHLSHDVIAQIADQPGMQGRQVGQIRRLEGLEDRLERRQDAVAGHPGADAGVQVERAGSADHAPPGGDDGQRVAADEGVPSPALASFHGLEQETRSLPHDP